jgi:iron(III) transport system permease protein
VTDFVLLGSVALPGIVLAAGYIFTYNLPVLQNIGLDLYETTPLLLMGYVATALPQQARLLVGPVSQLQESLVLAARVHGSSAIGAWGRTVVPVLSRVILWGALLTFAKTLLELPVSQLLYPPGNRPISVAINFYVSGLHYDTGTAMTVVALVEEFGVIVLALGLFRLLAPSGWRRGLGAR